MTTPYLHLKKSGERVTFTGTASAIFGQESETFVKWNWENDRLTVESDYFGFPPLFYFVRENEICLSPSLVKLAELGAPLDLDDAAMAVFLRVGFFLDQDTPFKAIRAFPPNSTLNWRDGKLEIQTREYLVKKSIEISRREAIENYANLFRQSIERRLPENENFVVPLSGGRDSRHILFELARAGAKPRACLTLRHLPPRSNEDAKISAEICRKLGINHVVLPQPASRLQAELAKNLQTHFCADEHGWFLPMAEYVENQQFEHLYDGIAGDALSGDTAVWSGEGILPLLALFENGDFDKLADVYLETEGYLPDLLSSEYYRRFSREIAAARLSRELAKHADAPNPLQSFQFWNRTRREIGLVPFSMLNSGPKISTPYLDRRLFDFLTSLPARATIDLKLHTQAIDREFPQFAEIPYEKKPFTSVPNIGHYKHFGREILYYAFRQKSVNFVNKKFYLTRLLRSQIDSKYSLSVTWLAAPAIYLVQLENFIRENREKTAVISARSRQLPQASESLFPQKV